MASTNPIAIVGGEYMRQASHERPMPADPMSQFTQWLNEAVESDAMDPTSMTLATCAGDVPSARIVLLKGVDDRGFIFYTNYESRKGVELGQNPNACLLFFWHELNRQVRIEGRVRTLPREESA